MEIEKIAEKLKDLIIGEIREEFREFKSSVTGELAGYRIAIESMNGRMAGIEARQAALESEIRDMRKAIDETNKRIDETNKRINDINKRIDETNKRIDETNKRIDETNKRIDDLRAELKTEIMLNTQRIDDTNKRIDETNKRIDDLMIEVSHIRGDLKKALSQKEVMNDILTRLQRVEIKVFETA